MTAAIATNKLYAGRKRRNRLMMGLAYCATLFGLGWLVLILGALPISVRTMYSRGETTVAE